MQLALFKFRELGKKFISEYWEGIKLATKLVDADEIIMKKMAITVIDVLSNLPTISVGLVRIELKSRNLKFKNTSDPITIKTEKKEKISKLISKLKLPFLSSLSLLTYREKSPKVTIIIEKYAKIAPATDNRAKIFSSSKRLL